MVDLGIELLDGDDARERIHEKTESGEWWVFVGSHSSIVAIEEKFYSGHGEDFEILVGPPAGVFAEVYPARYLLQLSFARKTRLSAERLAAFLEQMGAPTYATAETLSNRDILFFGEDD